ncbi:neutral zinc metallopeptidase [Isosphaeraceae bacterium EP7]
MRLDGREETENVEDRRGVKGAGMTLGLGSLVIILIGLFLGVDPRQLMQFVAKVNPPAVGQAQPGAPAGPVDPVEEKEAHFTKVIFRDTEDVWNELFSEGGQQYEKPVLVLYSDLVESACGQAQSAVGPFYCPGDGKVYIDLSFYRDMETQLNAPGDFAQAYVVAHEVGHHVQRLLGYSKLVDQARKQGDEVESNRMSVRLELQADYLAGVWANHGNKKFNFLEEGDVESALNAANQIGDDRLQKKSRGYVVPDGFTHGTSKQRQRWFSEGLRTGDVNGAQQLFKLRYEDL